MMTGKIRRKTSGLAATALLALTFVAPVEAAKAVKAAKGEYTLDPEKGDVRASLTALATAIGATVVGDSPKLAQPAPAAAMTGTPAKLLKRLLGDQSYVVKTDDKGKITQVVIMSGQRGKDPLPQAKPPASTTASNTGPGMSTTTASMVANARLSQASPTYGGAAQFPGKGAPAQPIPPQQPNAASTQPTATATIGTPAQPVTITPEMQAQIAAATQQARGQLDTLVTQLKAACPAGQKC